MTNCLHEVSLGDWSLFLLSGTLVSNQKLKNNKDPYKQIENNYEETKRIKYLEEMLIKTE